MNIDWTEYDRVHASRSNLALHLFAVPLFIASILSLFKYLLRGDWVSVVIVVVTAILAMALQGKGHKLEPNQPRSFNSPTNFLRRWFTEQFVIFPLFFITGRWWRQYRAEAVHNES